MVQFTSGLDSNTRQRAMHRTNVQALGIVTGWISDAVNVANDMNEMKQIVEEMNEGHH